VKILAAMVLTLVWSASTLAVAADGQGTTKPATQVCTLKVSGMTCAGCEAAVKMAARSVDGVTDVKPDAIAKVITDKSGFKAEPVRNAAKK